jgi:peptidoglycan biosynthesis protein MviN/MurJ (putative lipid II flippase)
MLYRQVGGGRVGPLFINLGKVLGAGLVMAGVVSLCHTWLAAALGSGLLGQLLAVSGAIFVGIAVYGGLIALLAIPEFQDLRREVQARLKGSRV